ncbi:peptidoglycan-binding protein [Kitasatospora sp. NPDC050543]|uniref:peptidoglycan-binding protein n=1 Tax=Kitasatospora sp. NPDC050543 TaxID=3364054 RepID=UPI0037B1D904
MRKQIISGIAMAGVIFAGGVVTASTASAAQPGQRCSDITTWEPLLRGGENNSAVMAMQCELNNALYGAGLDQDGKFGPATQAAVYKFQKCAGIQQDGQVGPQTWAKLDYWSNSTAWVPCN